MPTSTKFQVSNTDKQRIYEFIKQNGYVTNRQVRSLLNISYDQAIHLFNQMVENRDLIREGKTSSVRYVLPKQFDQ
ncbi:MAG: hypothetical protein NTW32_27525 [Chloroflexi bacterium]|nr:hypothetical protein [Chloroflexota bacterium]